MNTAEQQFQNDAAESIIPLAQLYRDAREMDIGPCGSVAQLFFEGEVEFVQTNRLAGPQKIWVKCDGRSVRITVVGQGEIFHRPLRDLIRERRERLFVGDVSIHIGLDRCHRPFLSYLKTDMQDPEAFNLQQGLIQLIKAD